MSGSSRSSSRSVRAMPLVAARKKGASQLAQAGAQAVRLPQAPQRVRIIGGQYKRTPLPVLSAPGLRPTPDRLRETLFNWIAHLRPDLSSVRGLDLFAGTGALGFELASRGAAAVTLIERDPRIAAALVKTQSKLSAQHVSVVTGDAVAVVRRLAGPFDLVFIDPPYAAQLVSTALAAVAPKLTASALVYVEDEQPIEPALAARYGLQLVRQQQAGRVVANLLECLPAAEAA